MFSYRLTMGAIGPHEEVHTITANGYISSASAAIAAFKAYALKMKALSHACEKSCVEVFDSADPSFSDIYEICY